MKKREKKDKKTKHTIPDEKNIIILNIKEKI